ncbi:MAG: patatin-like phospholipase family protein [Chloroflexaceae bacterium]|nr:patatin-like phospholipase family protein [Chloroflexaceae bacterium]
MQPTRKVLVLSGGGGRGAYHIGVIEALVEQGWIRDGVGPDILAGTSIGAINAAALASGHTIDRLKHYWLDMHTEDVHRLSPDLPAFARPMLRFLLHSVLTSQAHGGSAVELPPEYQKTTVGSLFDRLGLFFRNRPFQSLLDTAPWRYTLQQWIDFERINTPDAPALLLTATEIHTGKLRVFCNRPLPNQPADYIGLDHLMASSSIPVVYPPTVIGQQAYWDGAVLSNTPLGPVMDLVGSDPVDIIVVMMTPWCDSTDMPEHTAHEPSDLVQMVGLTLDWALLASYRVAMKTMKNYNRLADAAALLDRAAEQTGDDSLRLTGPRPRHIDLPTIIAPEHPIPLEWMVDYEEANHRALFAMGKCDAIAALQRRR